MTFLFNISFYSAWLTFSLVALHNLPPPIVYGKSVYHYYHTYYYNNNNNNNNNYYYNYCPPGHLAQWDGTVVHAVCGWVSSGRAVWPADCVPRSRARAAAGLSRSQSDPYSSASAATSDAAPGTGLPPAEVMPAYALCTLCVSNNNRNNYNNSNYYYYRPNYCCCWNCCWCFQFLFNRPSFLDTSHKIRFPPQKSLKIAAAGLLQFICPFCQSQIQVLLALR